MVGVKACHKISMFTESYCCPIHKDKMLLTKFAVAWKQQRLLHSSIVFSNCYLDMKQQAWRQNTAAVETRKLFLGIAKLQYKLIKAQFTTRAASKTFNVSLWVPSAVADLLLLPLVIGVSSALFVGIVIIAAVTCCFMKRLARQRTRK